ncbi:hypothetical protein E2562_019191 [Oryza meyeriana var. granulata]|uniref:Uncharacterized protein n=1 Tax=Oryza meyeriana var. granulata TaxID=110450 RepID=A0A6G1F9Y3_9ORYZ|nr:hypothetical protein E2562_019191 [Oryza meyeriana var. granulata]
MVQGIFQIDRMVSKWIDGTVTWLAAVALVGGEKEGYQCNGVAGRVLPLGKICFAL